MTSVMSRLALAAAVVCMTTGVSQAQTTTASTETKTFEVLAVNGNLLDVRFPEGTRELTVPEDFRFTVNGAQLSVHDLKVGMKGTATITTRTTVTPVTVTEVKDGTVVVRSSAGVIVRTNEGVKSFTQADIDKRGIKPMRSGQPAQVSDFREGDKLSATFITAGPPHVLTEKEVQALVPANAAAAPRSGGATATRTTSGTAAVDCRRPLRRPRRSRRLRRAGPQVRLRPARAERCRRPRARGRSSGSQVSCRSHWGSH